MMSPITITITTKPEYHPCARYDRCGIRQRQIVDFGNTLPILFLDNVMELYLDPILIEASVRVSHKQTHGQDVNAPDVSIAIQFSQQPLTDNQTTNVLRHLEKLIASHLNPENFGENISIAVDCFWGPTHGFSFNRGVELEW